MGAHNPKCLLGKENAKEPVSVFKCATCARTESTIAETRQKNVASPENVGEVIDKSIFMTKTNNQNEEAAISSLPSFSEDDETQSSDSFVTVIPQKNSTPNLSIPHCATKESISNDHNEIISTNSNKDISVEVSANTEVIEVIDCSDEETMDEVRETTSSQKQTDPQLLKFGCSDEETSNEGREKPTEPPSIASQVLEINCSDGHSRSADREKQTLPRPIELVTEINCPDKDTQMESREKSATPQPVASQVKAINYSNEGIQIQVTENPPTPQTVESQVMETNSNEETRNLVSKPSTSRPIMIGFDDEETQLFGKSSAVTPETEVVKKASLPQQSGFCDIKDEETQLFDICNLDKQKTDKTIEVLPSYNKELRNITKTLTTTTTSQCVDATNEIVCVQDTNPLDDINQSPIVSSSSQAEENYEWLIFDVYEYDNKKSKCIGSATMCINLHDERFAGMTLEGIEENSSNILNDGDIISHSDDIGIFAKIDAIIAEYTK